VARSADISPATKRIYGVNFFTVYALPQDCFLSRMPHDMLGGLSEMPSKKGCDFCYLGILLGRVLSISGKIGQLGQRGGEFVLLLIERRFGKSS